MEFTLRKLTLDDAEDLAKAANNPNVARYLRKVFPCPYKLQDAIDYINYATDNKADIIFGIVVDGSVCGCVCARMRGDVYAKSCELGYWLTEQLWGKGLMTRVVKAFCEFVFDNYDIHRIDAEVFADNVASRRVLEKVGFALEGVCRQKVYKDNLFVDEATYALLKT